MNSHIGHRETSAAIIIFSITPSFAVLVGVNSAHLGSGAILNCALCFVISLLALLPFKIYFKIFPDSAITDAANKTSGTLLSWVVTLSFSFLVFFLAVFSISFLSKSIFSLMSETIDISHIKLIFCIASAICAWLGLEALTRQSYALLYIAVAIIVLIVFSIFKGLNPDNLYPLFGNSITSTFSNCYSFCVLSGLAPFLLVCDRIGDKKAYICARRSVCISFAITLLMILIYSLTVARPLGSLFGTSLEAVFASGSSGNFFHRFELFMASLYVILAIGTSSFSLLSVSYGLSRLCRVEDYRPFVLILSLILYNLSKYSHDVKTYIGVCLLASFLSMALPLGISLIKCKSRG